MTRSRILIADDHPLVRDALKLVIASKWPGVAIDEAGSVSEIEALVRGGADYSLALLDLMLPDAHGFSGLIFLKKLLEKTPVVMVSSRHDTQTVATAHVLGASGFVPKSTPLLEMATAFEKAMAGETSFPVAPPSEAPNSGTVDIAEAGRRIAALSAAQLRILLALADGRLNKQIADDMGITEATVKAHMTAIFRKLGVNNRTQAILAARPLLESGA
jgi:DNA-binding NarL/FixJ family response regulator